MYKNDFFQFYAKRCDDYFYLNSDENPINFLIDSMTFKKAITQNQ